ALVYVLAGICAGLVHLSSHPVEVTAGSTGAIFGLYGLMIATIGCQLLFYRRAAVEEIAPDPQEPQPADWPARIPHSMVNRLAIAAALFIAFILASGRATGAEPAALGVGLVFGLAIASLDGTQHLDIRRIAIAAGAIAAFATAYAIPLNHIAD